MHLTMKDLKKKITKKSSFKQKFKIDWNRLRVEEWWMRIRIWFQRLSGNWKEDLYMNLDTGVYLLKLGWLHLPLQGWISHCSLTLKGEPNPPSLLSFPHFLISLTCTLFDVWEHKYNFTTLKPWNWFRIFFCKVT